MAARASIEVAAIVFAESKRGSTFTAREFGGFLGMAGEVTEDERSNEILLELVRLDRLKEIGPGVYALPPLAPVLESGQ